MRKFLVLLFLFTLFSIPTYAQTQGVHKEDRPHVSGDDGVAVLFRRCDVANVSSGTDGDYSIPCVDSSGNLRVSGTISLSETDPCTYMSGISYPISITSSTRLITGVSAEKIYICSLVFNTATAQNISIVEGTGSVCATNIVGVIGGDSAATGFNFADNQGLSWGNGGATLAQTSIDANDLCILISGSAQVSGHMRVVLK